MKKLILKLLGRCNHDFGMWGDLIQPYNTFDKQQARRCKKCGLIEMRTFQSRQVAASIVQESIKESDQ